MLATASLGAIWSSCSPDFGATAVLDRFGQIRPKVLFCGRRVPLRGQGMIDCVARVGEVLRAGCRRRAGGGGALPRRRRAAPDAMPRTPSDGSTLARAGRRGAAARFERLPFDHPALHPLLLGHDRAAQVHRARRRRHAAAAPQGARAAHRSHPRRPDLLLHHLRLDDVELDGDQPGGRRHGGALRRRPARAGDRTSSGTWPRRSGVTVFGTSAKYLALCEKAGL